MRNSPSDPSLPLPRHWTRSIQAALLHAISLAQYALVYTRSWAVNSSNQRVRLAARVDQLEQEIALLRQEVRLKDARLGRIPAGQRPHYLPTERLEILELRAARGWSLAQTARVFQVTTATIFSWTKRLDEEGPGVVFVVGGLAQGIGDAGHVPSQIEGVAGDRGLQLALTVGVHPGNRDEPVAGVVFVNRVGFGINLLDQVAVVVVNIEERPGGDVGNVHRSAAALCVISVNYGSVELTSVVASPKTYQPAGVVVLKGV